MNRYKGLFDENQAILELTPADVPMRVLLAKILGERLARHRFKNVLELGAGEGNLTKYILRENPLIGLDVTDISTEMLTRARTTIDCLEVENTKIPQGPPTAPKDTDPYKVRFHVLDARNFEGEESYSAVVSAYTVHNFTAEEKRLAFRSMYRALCPGGTMLLMDKIYTGGPSDEEMLERQITRFRQGLTPAAFRKMEVHEREDYETRFRMTEEETLEMLSEAGFKDLTTYDRIERELLLGATK